MRLGASWSSVLPGLAAGSVAGLVVALIVVVVGDDGDASLDEAALGEVVEAAVEPLVEEVVADFDRAVEAAVTQAVSEALAQRAAEAGSMWPCNSCTRTARRSLEIDRFMGSLSIRGISSA